MLGVTSSGVYKESKLVIFTNICSQIFASDAFLLSLTHITVMLLCNKSVENHHTGGRTDCRACGNDVCLAKRDLNVEIIGANAFWGL